MGRAQGPQQLPLPAGRGRGGEGRRPGRPGLRRRRRASRRRCQSGRHRWAGRSAPGVGRGQRDRRPGGAGFRAGAGGVVVGERRVRPVPRRQGVPQRPGLLRRGRLRAGAGGRRGRREPAPARRPCGVGRTRASRARRAHPRRGPRDPRRHGRRPRRHPHTRPGGGGGPAGLGHRPGPAPGQPRPGAHAFGRYAAGDGRQGLGVGERGADRRGPDDPHRPVRAPPPPGRPRPQGSAGPGGQGAGLPRRRHRHDPRCRRRGRHVGGTVGLPAGVAGGAHRRRRRPGEGGVVVGHADPDVGDDPAGPRPHSSGWAATPSSSTSAVPSTTGVWACSTSPACPIPAIPTTRRRPTPSSSS